MCACLIQLYTKVLSEIVCRTFVTSVNSYFDNLCLVIKGDCRAPRSQIRERWKISAFRLKSLAAPPSAGPAVDHTMNPDRVLLQVLLHNLVSCRASLWQAGCFILPATKTSNLRCCVINTAAVRSTPRYVWQEMASSPTEPRPLVTLLFRKMLRTSGYVMAEKASNETFVLNIFWGPGSLSGAQLRSTVLDNLRSEIPFSLAHLQHSKH